jgi:hypothetical protein
MAGPVSLPVAKEASIAVAGGFAFGGLKRLERLKIPSLPSFINTKHHIYLQVFALFHQRTFSGIYH